MVVGASCAAMGISGMDYLLGFLAQDSKNGEEKGKYQVKSERNGNTGLT